MYAGITQGCMTCSTQGDTEHAAIVNLAKMCLTGEGDPVLVQHWLSDNMELIKVGATFAEVAQQLLGNSEQLAVE